MNSNSATVSLDVIGRTVPTSGTGGRFLLPPATEVSLPPILPLFPDWPINGPLILFPAQWHALGQALKAIHDDNEHNAQTLAVLNTKFAALNTQLETLRMAMDDIGASQDRAEASTTAALAGITTEIQQVRDAVAALGTSPTPEQLAALKARIDANADRIDAAVASMSADDTTPPTP